VIQVFSRAFSTGPFILSRELPVRRLTPCVGSWADAEQSPSHNRHSVSSSGDIADLNASITSLRAPKSPTGTMERALHFAVREGSHLRRHKCSPSGQLKRTMRGIHAIVTYLFSQFRVLNAPKKFQIGHPRTATIYYHRSEPSLASTSAYAGRILSMITEHTEPTMSRPPSGMP
jgi:hypothetical protein